MSFQPNTRVHATHDIQRGHHRLVQQGALGVVVDAHPHWTGGSYTVEFASTGMEHSQPATTIIGLTDGDVEPE